MYRVTVVSVRIVTAVTEISAAFCVNASVHGIDAWMHNRVICMAAWTYGGMDAWLHGRIASAGVTSAVECIGAWLHGHVMYKRRKMHGDSRTMRSRVMHKRAKYIGVASCQTSMEITSAVCHEEHGFIVV